jgi:tetratricopeptide (TPR) repeat protein
MNETLLNAIRLREEGKHEAACAELSKLVQQEPDDAVIHYQCAWAHDNLGLEQEAIQFYERAIALGLEDIDLQAATLGLGSSYCCVGEYAKSVSILQQGVERFPSNRAIQVFLALSLHKAGESREAVALLLKNLAETSSDESILKYKRAILHYSNEL